MRSTEINRKGIKHCLRFHFPSARSCVIVHICIHFAVACLCNDIHCELVSFFFFYSFRLLVFLQAKAKDTFCTHSLEICALIFTFDIHCVCRECRLGAVNLWQLWFSSLKFLSLSVSILIQINREFYQPLCLCVRKRISMKESNNKTSESKSKQRSDIK